MKIRKHTTRIFAILALIAVLIGALMLPIGAESTTETTVAETPAYTSPIDWSAYPSTNLWPHGNVTIYENIILELSLPAGEYTLSCNIESTDTDSKNRRLIFKNNNNNTQKNVYISDGLNTITFILSNDITNINIATSNSVENSKNDTATLSNIMLNKGNIAYPYQPYIPYFINQGYQNGYSEGYETGNTDGYDQGYDDALNSIEMVGVSVWEYARIDCTAFNFIDSNNVNDVYYRTIPNIPFSTYTTEDGTIFLNTSSILEYVKNHVTQNTGQTIVTEKYIHLYIRFEERLTYFNKKGEYTGLVSYIKPYEGYLTMLGTLENSGIDTNKIRYSNTNGVYRIEPTNSPQNSEYYLSVYELDLILNNFELDIGTKAQASSEEYKSGYAQGYLDAATTEYTELLDEKYKTGYKEGFTSGKKEGLEISKNGDWKNLMTAVVEAPVNTFQSLFNFEILGLDMRAAFGSVLAICVILIIIKKVIL